MSSRGTSTGRVRRGRVLRPREKKKIDVDDSVHWEEQQQIERALRASLNEHRPTSALSQKSPTTTIISSSSTNVAGHSKSTTTTIDCASSSSSIGTLLSEQSTHRLTERHIVSNLPTADRKYPSTDDFLRYLCFKDTDFMPKDLKRFDRIEIDRFTTITTKGNATVESPDMPILLRQSSNASSTSAPGTVSMAAALSITDDIINTTTAGSSSQITKSKRKKNQATISQQLPPKLRKMPSN